MFRFEDRVTLELADPVAFLGLLLQEPVGGSIQGRCQGILRETGRAAHRAASGQRIRRLRKYASVLDGDHAFATLSLDSRRLEHEKPTKKRTTSDAVSPALARSGAHPTCVMQIRSRSNFAKISGRFGSIQSPAALKICLFCERPAKPRRRTTRT